MGIVNKIKAIQNSLWVVLFVLVNNSFWIMYSCGESVHGNEVWNRNLDDLCQFIFCFGGIMVFYKLFILIEDLAKMANKGIRKSLGKDSLT